MTKPASDSAAAGAYYLANSGGLLVHKSGRWTVEPREAKAFSADNVTAPLFEVAELFDLTVIKLTRTDKEGRIQMYAFSPEVPFIEIWKCKDAEPLFRIWPMAEQFADPYIGAKEVEEHIRAFQQAIRLASLL